MIARMWRGWVRTELIDEYVDIVERTGMAGYRATPGNLGAQLLTRDLGDGRTELITLSWWGDLDEIRAFAGRRHRGRQVLPGGRRLPGRPRDDRVPLRGQRAGRPARLRPGRPGRPAGRPGRDDQARSKRSSSITLTQAATKSRTNFSCASSAAYTSASDRSTELEPKTRSTAVAVHFRSPLASVADLVDVLGRLRGLPLRAGSQQVDEEVVRQRLRAGR